MSRSAETGAPRKLICVRGFASGVPGSGEITSTGAGALATAARASAGGALPNQASTEAPLSAAMMLTETVTLSAKRREAANTTASSAKRPQSAS